MYVGHSDVFSIINIYVKIFSIDWHNKKISMPSHTMLNIKIKRESNNVPWGFRMQGKFKG